MKGENDVSDTVFSNSYYVSLTKRLFYALVLTHY